MIPDAGGNRERIAYVYDKRAVVFNGLTAEANEPRKKKGFEYLPESSFWRSPYMASFKSGNFDFVALTTHIRWATAKSRASLNWNGWLIGSKPSGRKNTRKTRT